MGILVGMQVAVVWFDFQELSQRGGTECERTANSGNKRVREVSHLELLKPRWHINSDDYVSDCSHSMKSTPLLIILPGHLFWQSAKVSNSDQLFLCDWAIMGLETSTSSLSFRSSELSQHI
jgi:hypothetical protein